MDQCVPSARSTAGDYSGLVSGGRGSVLLLATSWLPQIVDILYRDLLQNTSNRRDEGAGDSYCPTIH